MSCFSYTIVDDARRYLQFDWMFYLNTFMPTPITDDEPIVTLVPDYLRDMAELVARQDKRSIIIIIIIIIIT